MCIWKPDLLLTLADVRLSMQPIFPHTLACLVYNHSESAPGALTFNLLSYSTHLQSAPTLAFISYQCHQWSSALLQPSLTFFSSSSTPSHTLNRFFSLLSHHSNAVHSLTSSVPQGSILGSTVFSIAILPYGFIHKWNISVLLIMIRFTTLLMLVQKHLQYFSHL